MIILFISPQFLLWGCAVWKEGKWFPEPRIIQVKKNDVKYWNNGDLRIPRDLRTPPYIYMCVTLCVNIYIYSVYIYTVYIYICNIMCIYIYIYIYSVYIIYIFIVYYVYIYIMNCICLAELHLRKNTSLTWFPNTCTFLTIIHPDTSRYYR